MPRRKKKNKLPKWLSDYILELPDEKITRIMNERYYPHTMEYGPDEISRYILDFINPIHSPPSKYKIWTQNRKKKWCKKCGETCVPNSPTCRACCKPFSWICTNCDKITVTNVCKRRIFPPDPEDSDYSSSYEQTQ